MRCHIELICDLDCPNVGEAERYCSKRVPRLRFLLHGQNGIAKRQTVRRTATGMDHRPSS